MKGAINLQEIGHHVNRYIDHFNQQDIEVEVFYIASAQCYTIVNEGHHQPWGDIKKKLHMILNLSRWSLTCGAKLTF